jgi:hypothetical protein
MKQTINLSGRSTLRAYPRGVLEFHMGRGESLADIHRLWKPFYMHQRRNLIVTSGRDLVAKMLIDEEDTGLTYHAIGTSATAPVIADTALGSEENRKAWTSKVRTGSVIVFTMFYLASESQYNIQEVGIFGGATASATPDSGTLFSHFLQEYDNTAGLVDLTFEYELTVGVP